MKTCLLILCLFAALLAGCAQHDFELANGKRGTRGKLQSNGTNITIRATPTSYYFHADTLDNATATRAGGEVVEKTGNAATKLGTAVVGGGFVP